MVKVTAHCCSPHLPLPLFLSFLFWKRKAPQKKKLSAGSMPTLMKLTLLWPETKRQGSHSHQRQSEGQATLAAALLCLSQGHTKCCTAPPDGEEPGWTSICPIKGKKGRQRSSFPPPLIAHGPAPGGAGQRGHGAAPSQPCLSPKGSSCPTPNPLTWCLVGWESPAPVIRTVLSLSQHPAGFLDKIWSLGKSIACSKKG